jgi:DNA-binding NarL/FixJ family response regulator
MPVAATITVAIIDDNRVMREVLAEKLEQLSDMRPIAATAAGLAFLVDTKPNVLLLDLGLSDDDSLSLASAARKTIPKTKIIVMDLLPVDEEIAGFVHAGVAGFILKDASFAEFVDTIRAVAGGKRVLPLPLTESLFADVAITVSDRGNDQMLDLVHMTRREHEVIDLIGEGLCNKDIALRLNVATHTVKSHVHNVMEKLALHSRLQIAAYTYRHQERPRPAAKSVLR